MNEEIKRNTNRITIPLPDALRNMVKREMNDSDEYKRICCVIEETVAENDENECYAALLEKIEPYLKDKTRNFVGKLFMFKKRICRDGERCKRGDNCIFLHENEAEGADYKNIEARREVFNNNNNNIRKREFETEPNKRIKNDTKFSNKEVILNNLPEDLWDDVIISDYCKEFGSVSEVRMLKPGKYLIKFFDPSSAYKFISSTEKTFGRENIKKFYNKFVRKGKEEILQDLFDEQKCLLQEMQSIVGSEASFVRLRAICIKIRSLVNSEENSDRENKNINFKDNGINKKNSVYFNSFFNPTN
ncbi:hypothetical protein CWI39_1588p0010 [Hamiltosporidium magnivora]|uniref:C3H1-type domain-containing protein n=1 Tax=Hamiltosporidium magnivora TaxID=148818 RepID=A0A4Q9L0A2_9MICR|nr:hypothetical protein CWI39_1588p0010 [Hamiltosporidium magnivora]